MKFIFVVGGVISGVGKGIATASIAKILQQNGYTVTCVKIDPYINYDAGTLRPTEHGEVWVTDDGGEIDQDLGNYERFLGFHLPKRNNITTGQIYKELIDKERRGEFLGQTVEVIPHVPNEIKRRIMEAGKDYDFTVVEVGGTVGDYQNLPYLFAAKGMEHDVGRENVAYVLVTYLPVPSSVGEMKTKPTQQAIRMLNEAGIFPDFVLCRAPVPLDEVRKKKLETNANIMTDHVISAPDVSNIYDVPLNFEKEELGKKLLKRFNIMPLKEPDWTRWTTLVNNINNPERTIKIAMVGKYVDIGNFSLTDSYISVNQSVLHASAEFAAKTDIEWIDAKKIEREGAQCLDKFNGIIVPGGFGATGVEGKIMAIKYARKNNIPFLGLCYGLQMAVIEYARNVCNMTSANTTEVDKNTEFPVIDILESQKSVISENRYGASMRLGAYAAVLKDNTRVLELYKRTGRFNEDMERIAEMQKTSQTFRLGFLDSYYNIILERHRHRYEVNPDFVKRLEENGLVFSGFHHREDDTKLMEFIELPDHKFFVATQAHPEFKSRLGNPSPLFYGFIEACLKE